MKSTVNVNIGDLKEVSALIRIQKKQLRLCREIIETLMDLSGDNGIELEMYRELTDELQRNNKDLNIDAKYKEYYASYDIKGLVEKQSKRYKLIAELMGTLNNPLGESHE